MRRLVNGRAMMVMPDRLLTAIAVQLVADAVREFVREGA
jgi:hypothetical protein